MKTLATLALAAAVVAAPAVARAGVSLQLGLGSRSAEVGEGIRVELQAMSDGDAPGNPRLRVPPGFSVQGPNIASSQSISFSNGHFEHRRGITATWIVVPTKPGRFVIGPATVQSGSSAVQSQTATVEVVPQGSMPQQQQRQRRRNPFDPSDPFDPFSMMPKLPGFPNLDDLDGNLIPSLPEVPPEYSVEHAPEQMAFLRASVSPADAVVGQQVTLRIYAYAARGPWEEMGSQEPSHADFLSYVSVDGPYRQQRYMMDIDGTRWMAVKVREMALFPLHAGNLTVGSMKMGFRGPGYPETQPMQGLVRLSPELHVMVREAPIAGRPPGYELGNTGSYSLSAEIEPRRVTAGDAVGATIRLEGTGNVPHELKLPEQRGVEWLDPNITDSVAVHDGVVGGNRVFHYVVRLDEPGTHDLGEVTLPFYDPVSRRYQVARARLGAVEVLPGKAQPPAAVASASPDAKPEDLSASVGGPRKTLGAPAATPRHLTDSRWYIALLAGGPLGVVALGGLAELASRLRKRWLVRGRSPAALARRALGEAREAARRNDAAAVAAGVERALYTIIEDRLGLKARAVLRDGLRDRLERQGADRPLAESLVSVLDRCDKLRFSGGGDADAVVRDAESCTARLARITRGPAEQAA